MLTHCVGLGLPILQSVCLSLRLKGLGGSFPVSVVMQGSGWTFHGLWKLIVRSWSRICMLRKAVKGWCLLGKSPTPTLSAVLKIVT